MPRSGVGKCSNHSITSSARANTLGGTSKPSALAVLMLSTVFVFRRSLHREVGWFLAFQDAVDVGGGKPIQGGLINTEGDQSASVTKRRKLWDRMEP